MLMLFFINKNMNMICWILFTGPLLLCFSFVLPLSHNYFFVCSSFVSNKKSVIIFSCKRKTNGDEKKCQHATNWHKIVDGTRITELNKRKKANENKRFSTKAEERTRKLLRVYVCLFANFPMPWLFASDDARSLSHACSFAPIIWSSLSNYMELNYFRIMLHWE